jgi:lipopolysaccharide transport system permease protein
MVVFTIFFGKIAGFDEGLGGKYALLTFAALTPWTFFANGLTMSSNSLVGSADLIKKVYFPRLAIPISSVLSGAVDFVLVLAVLFGLMAYYGVAPSANILLLPFFLLLAFVTALGAGLWFSAMNVQFRDVRYTIPFLTQFWLFASPVAYPLSEVPEKWRLLYHLNPMVGVIEGFQWSLVGHGALEAGLIASTATALALLVGGAFYFRRMERSFADVV